MAERRALGLALAINAALFVAELGAGILAHSMGLVADSLDMLADASVYALSLFAVGHGTRRKRHLAAASGYLQLGLALVGLIEVSRRFLTSEPLPDPRVMIAVAAVALVGNVATLMLLRRARSQEAHFQASWIFTANDIKVNGLVIAAALVVLATGSATPDLVAGAVIFLIVANGARRILNLSRRDAAVGMD
jgi:Co/Zn/Cd efflux system component